MAANQVGKTLCAAAETSFHLTGNYPSWWQGRVFRRPVIGWAAGVTAESTRDNPQRLLLGSLDNWGTGTIPFSALHHVQRASHGIADSVDYVSVRHVSGGLSAVFFKSYERGRAKWQGPSLDFVWFDEEPPEDIYSEGLTRTNATDGITYVTFTPLEGITEVVFKFMKQDSPDRHLTSMTIDDAEHFTPAKREQIVASYKPHEREARARGVPILGSGRIFPVTEESIAWDAGPIPAHWPRVCGLDIGFDHPTAAAWVAWDRDADCLYVYDCYRVREASPVIHAAAVKARGTWIPVAWPHDALRNIDHGASTGRAYMTLYQDQGVNMHDTHSTFEDGSISVEAGLMEMLDRMQTGRLKVAKHLGDWWEEFRLYHRKDGKVVKERDDLMSATRLAVVMRRIAVVSPRKKTDDEQRVLAQGGGRGWMAS